MNREGNGNPTIVKRYSRREEERHGGAWKVAFADFALALMALFMVLWVMNVTPKEERERVAAEVSGNPLFDGGIGIFEQRSKRLDVDPFEATSRQGAEARARMAISAAASIDSVRERDALAASISREAHALGIDGNVAVALNDDGVRITVHDTDGNGMFVRRMDVLNPIFAKFLKGLAPVLSSVPNKLVVVGHTDATQYSGTSAFVNNWSLSTRRALQARQALLDGGFSAAQLLQVSGMGDSVPAVPEDGGHSMNRRVELLLLTTKGENVVSGLFRVNGVNAVPEIQGGGVRLNGAVGATGSAPN